MIYTRLYDYSLEYKISESPNTFESKQFLVFRWREDKFYIEVTGLDFTSKPTASQTQLMHGNNNIILKRVIHEVSKRLNVSPQDYWLEEQLKNEISRAIYKRMVTIHRSTQIIVDKKEEKKIEKKKQLDKFWWIVIFS